MAFKTSGCAAFTTTLSLQTWHASTFNGKNWISDINWVTACKQNMHKKLWCQRSRTNDMNQYNSLDFTYVDIIAQRCDQGPRSSKLWQHLSSVSPHLQRLTSRHSKEDVSSRVWIPSDRQTKEKGETNDIESGVTIWICQRTLLKKLWSPRSIQTQHTMPRPARSRKGNICRLKKAKGWYELFSV